MKSKPALPGGLLKSKPTWSNAFRVFRHVGFLVLLWRGLPRYCLRDSARRHHGLLMQVKEKCAVRFLLTPFPISLAVVACLLGATVSPLRGQGDSGSKSGGNASRRQAIGKPLAPQPGRDGGGLQRGANGGFHGLARNSIRSDSAQQSSNGGASPASSGREGASGDRRLGQPVAPHLSHSGVGLQRGPSGEFHGLPGNATSDRTPQQPRDADASTANSGQEEVFDDRWLGQPLDPNAESTFDVLQGDASGEFQEPNDTLTPSSSLGGDTTMSPLLQLRTSPPHGPDSQRGQVEIFSTDLSENLTQLARSGGVRTSTGVRVYLCGDGVVLHGTVASVQQSELIAALASMAPRVWSVDNRLTIAAQPDGLPPGRTGAAGDAVRPMRNLPVKGK
jgi:hypothetical protein